MELKSSMYTDEQKFKRRWPKIKLQRETKTGDWSIVVDCGDYDTVVTSSTKNREQALIHALAVAGVLVEIQEPDGYLNNLEVPNDFEYIFERG